MRLASVEVIPYALPFAAPYVTARGVLERREMVLLRLRDEDGVVGLGEAVPLSLRGGAGIEQVVRELTELGRSWDGALARSRSGEASQIPGEEAMSAPARCAARTALMDLGGRRAAAEAGGSGSGSDRAGVPAAEPGRAALPDGGGDGAPGPGGERGEAAVPCNATLVAGAPEEVAAEAERWARDGFMTFKLKLGAETANDADNRPRLRSRGGGDVEVVRAVRGALGPAARIRVDANEAWDLATAKRVLAELEPLGIELAEQPVTGLEAMAELAADTSIPLAADESVATLAEAERAVALGACAYTGIKLSKVGGPEEALAIADVLPAYLASALDGPVGIATAAQVALSLAETGHPERLHLAHGLATQRLFAETVAAVECELRNGLLHLPPGPGLGVEIDEEALQAHRI